MSGDPVYSLAFQPMNPEMITQDVTSATSFRAVVEDAFHQVVRRGLGGIFDEVDRVHRLHGLSLPSAYKERAVMVLAGREGRIRMNSEGYFVSLSEDTLKA